MQIVPDWIDLFGDSKYNSKQFTGGVDRTEGTHVSNEK